MVEQLTLGIVIAAALADSINPCVFGVLIFLLAYMTAVLKTKAKMLITSFIYIFSVYIAYFLIGIGMLTLAYTAGLARPFYWIAAFLAIGAGLLEIKDFFFYGKWFSLQILPGGAERIKKITGAMSNFEAKHPNWNYLIAAGLGIFVVLVELPCTGAPYFAILGLLASGSYTSGILLLLLYNFIFILPLFFIVGMFYIGKTSKTLEKWRKKHRALMRLGIGLFLLALGGYMLWTII